MNTLKAMFKSSKAGTGTSKTDVKFVELKSLFLVCEGVLILLAVF